MDFEKLCAERYSLRKYADRPVEAEKLEKVLEAGHNAPTAHNLQPQRILVMQSREALEKAEECTACKFHAPVILVGAPSGRMFQRVKVPNPPDSGKDIAKSKGVLGNWESEGSWRQITGLTNRNHEG